MQCNPAMRLADQSRGKPSVAIQIVIIVIFTPQLENPQSPEFKTLATQVESAVSFKWQNIHPFSKTAYLL